MKIGHTLPTAAFVQNSVPATCRHIALVFLTNSCAFNGLIPRDDVK